MTASRCALFSLILLLAAMPVAAQEPAGAPGCYYSQTPPRIGGTFSLDFCAPLDTQREVVRATILPTRPSSAASITARRVE